MAATAHCELSMNFGAFGAALTRVRILNLRELASHLLRVVTSLIVVIVASGLLIAVLGAYGSMTDTVRKIREQGKEPSEEQLKRCFNPKNGLIACAILIAPGLLLAIVNLVTADPASAKTGIIGVIFDRDALGVSNLQRRVTTNYNAKAEFYTNFYKFDAGYFNDLNENFVVFFVA